MKNMKQLNVREKAAEKARGRAWFGTLSRHDKGELGDAFVLDTFDWTEWLSRKPTGAFLNGAEEARVLWEVTDEG